MKTRAMLLSVLGLCGGLALGGGPAHAAAVLPVGSNLKTIASDVTIIVADGAVPVIGTPFAFQVTVPSSATTVVATLVPPPATPVFNGTTNPFLTMPGCPCTSAYPGETVNSGDPADLGPDVIEFTFDPATRSGSFKPVDGAAMAVIQVTVDGGAPLKFILPPDGSPTEAANGIADSWQATFCPSTYPCPLGTEDVDAGPLVGSRIGDGLAAFDEYRGIRKAAGQHVRLDPRQRDLVVGVRQGQCDGSATLTYLGGGAKTYPTQGNGGLLDNLAALLPATNVHVLGFSNGPLTGWVDNVASFTPAQGGFVYTTPDGAVTDRQINRNALFPVLDTVTLSTIQKGVRFTECFENAPAVISPTGSSGLVSPNFQGGNPILYTQRIVDNFLRLNTGLIARGGGRTLRYATYANGAWSANPTVLGAPPVPPATNDAADILISHFLKFVVAHEGGGHTLNLAFPLTPYQTHFATGTGDQLDQDVQCKVDKKAANQGGFNTCYIPSFYNGTDQSNFKLKD